MLNTVTRLKPRGATYEVAVEAYLNGDFSYCVEALTDASAFSAETLRSRALIRLGRLGEALDVLEHFVVETLTHEYAAEVLAVRAMTLIAMQDPRAEFALTEARARSFSAGFRPLECEVEFLVAMSAWTLGNVTDSLAAIERVLEISDSAPIFGGIQREDYLYTAAYWRSRAYDLRGLIEAGSEDFGAQANSLVSAFNEFEAGGVADCYFSARMLRNLAYLVRDLDFESSAAFVENRAELQTWNAHSGAAEYVVFHAIGLNRARRGDHLGAFRSLRRSATSAPTLPLQILAMLDRSFLARELGELLSAQDDLDHCVRLSKQVDWEKADVIERSALYELARVLAPIDVTSATALWHRYSGLKSGVSMLELASCDRRLRADECWAHAAVLAAQSQTSRAITLLLESFEIWTEVGYLWRAAAVALELAELTGEPRYVDVASREAAKQPNSWLARRVAALKVPAAV